MSMLPVYAKALVKALPFGPQPGASLPDREIGRSVALEATAYAGFTRVVEAPLTDTVHPGYLHILAFPLSMQLLADPAVPLPLVGMVHVRNRMDVHRPVRIGDVVDLNVSLAGPFTHPAGTTIDVVMRASVDGELAVTETTTYLAKGKHLDGAKPQEQPEREDFVAPRPTALWRLDPIIGQRYAKASGDYNPIHLNGLAARGFGFPRVIAHGMYTASRALAVADPRLDAYRWDVSFAKPILLPSTVGFAFTAGHRHESARFAVFDPSKGKPHVLSSVEAIEG